MWENQGESRMMSQGSFKCRACGKVVTKFIGQEWGWTHKGRMCCSYHCMRALQKADTEPDKPADGKLRQGQKKRSATDICDTTRMNLSTLKAEKELWSIKLSDIEDWTGVSGQTVKNILNGFRSGMVENVLLIAYSVGCQLKVGRLRIGKPGHLAGAIQNEMVSQRISWKDLARMCDISEMTLRRWDRENIGRASFDAVVRAIEGLGMEVSIVESGK